MGPTAPAGVDDIDLVLRRERESPEFTGVVGAPARADIADLDRENARTGRDAVTARVLGRVPRRDRSDVRAVRAAHRDHRQQIAAGVNLHAEGRKRDVAKRTVVARNAEGPQYLFIAQIAVFIGVDHHAPIGSVLPEHAVVECAGIDHRLRVFQRVQRRRTCRHVALGPRAVGRGLGPDRLQRRGFRQGGPLRLRPREDGGPRLGPPVVETFQNFRVKKLRGGLEAEPVVAGGILDALRQREFAPAQTEQLPVRIGLALGGRDDIAGAGGIEDIDDLALARRRDCETRGRRIDAGVPDRDDDAPTVPRRICLQKSIRSDLAFRNQRRAQRDEIKLCRCRRRREGTKTEHKKGKSTNRGYQHDKTATETAPLGKCETLIPKTHPRPPLPPRLKRSVRPLRHRAFQLQHHQARRELRRR